MAFHNRTSLDFVQGRYKRDSNERGSENHDCVAGKEKKFMGLPIPSFVEISRSAAARGSQECAYPSSRCASARASSARNKRASSKDRSSLDGSEWGLISSLREEIAARDAVIGKLTEEIRRLKINQSSVSRLQGSVQHESLYKRKSSSGGISSDSNEGGDREVTGCARLRSGSRLAEMRDRLKDSKLQNAVAIPRSARTAARKYADEIDAVVQEHLGEQDVAGRLKRVSYGVYSLGAKRIGISVKNGKPLVRIGGGASVSLDTYLDTH